MGFSEAKVSEAGFGAGICRSSEWSTPPLAAAGAEVLNAELAGLAGERYGRGEFSTGGFHPRAAAAAFSGRNERRPGPIARAPAMRLRHAHHACWGGDKW